MLEISDLTFSYGEKLILDHLNLEMPLSGLTALSGPSGCGKTTLLRILAGLEVPACGQVRGISPKKTAMLFQEDRLLPWRTVQEHLTDVLPRRAALPAADDSQPAGSVEAWLSFAELENEADTYPDQLSGGMARRLALARCCIFCKSHQGTLLLLDEPFTGIDLKRRERLIGRIRLLGIPAILASHEQDVLEACDRVLSFENISAVF